MPGEVADIALMTDSLGLRDISSKTGELSSASVVARAKAGDPAAFEELIDCYQRKVLSTAWRMLGNREDAYDLTQDPPDNLDEVGARYAEAAPRYGMEFFLDEVPA